MKKISLNVDKESAKKFLLEHSEKIIFGGVVACAAVIVYLALVQESFPKAPKELEDSAGRAKEHIDKNEPELPDSIKLSDYESSVSRSLDDIDSKRYEFDKPFDQPIFPSLRLRGVPKLYRVEELQGTSGVGPFTMLAPRKRPGGVAAGDGDKIRGLRWIVVTGLVSADQQAEAFGQYFRDRLQSNPETDVAKYLYFSIERAEATDSDDPAQLAWKSLHVGNAKAAMKTQFRLEDEKATMEQFKLGKETVDQQFIEDALVVPLLERADGDWKDPLIVHPDLLPQDDADEPGPDTTPTPGTPAVPDRPAVDNVPMGDPVEEPELPAEEPSGSDPSAVAAADQTHYKLFRFFDFSVQPGKQYRYRARLWLNNPNYGVDPPALEKVDPGSLPRGTTGEPAELSRSKWVWTAWSDPTEAISMPRDTRLLAVSVTAPIRISSPPSAKMMIVKWANTFGKFAYKEFAVTRGKVMNYTDQVFQPGKASEEDDGVLPRRAAAPPPVDSMPVDYMTDALVLDMRGGKRRMGETRDPGEILVLDAGGKLVVYNELADLAEYQKQIGIVTPEQSDPVKEDESGSGGRTEDNLDFLR